jgi:phosphatidylglycerol:prolipoprotein diacylglycerol transferase
VTFPVYFHVFGLRIHPHPVMEMLGYALGFELYVWLKKRTKQVSLPFEENLWLIVGCALGAAVGSKALAIVESIHAYWPHRHEPAIFWGGKTIVGGLAGGWIGAEIVKHRFKIFIRTGDLFVYPLILGMSIGRIGCFLTGLDDDTYGNATRLPWGVDFGDGIPRHPTQLYDIVFLTLFGFVLLPFYRRPHPAGKIFRMFMLGYVLWRFSVEFIKPRETYFGLSPIQMASLLIAIVCAIQLRVSAQNKRDGVGGAMPLPNAV